MSKAQQKSTRGQASPDETPESAEETTECQNCGRIFSGTYCPDCGQRVNPPDSIWNMVVGFVRQLVGVQRGFWHTFTGLTLRPGRTLRDYLRGVRKDITRPQGYLLTAVMVEVVIDHFLAKIGVAKISFSSSEESSSPAAEGSAKFYAEVRQPITDIFQGQYLHWIPYLLMAGLLAFLLYRLFKKEMDRFGKALAIGSFLMAQLTLLTAALGILYRVPVSLYLRQPVKAPEFVLFVLPIYAAVACYGCFGPGWKAALKGAFAACWGFIELFSSSFVGMGVYGIWLIQVYPERYLNASGAQEAASSAWGLTVQSGVLAFVFSLPILVHFGVEVYCRLR